MYVDQLKFPPAANLLNKAIELNPKDDNAYYALAWFYFRQFEFPQAAELYKKVITLNPKNQDAYLKLGRIYRQIKEYVKAEECFKKATELVQDQDSRGAYVALGQLYWKLKRYPEAEACFKKAIELNPQDDEAYGGLALVYEETDKDASMRIYYKKRDEFSQNYYKPITRQNYLAIKEILDKKGVKLVCIQYPMLSIGSLKGIFKEQDNIIFVDNERIFIEAISKTGYDDYFVDMFRGDFGHCTRKGNRLLAENIANTILREYFKK
jgi:tetratricopeptide (TPR) repeat protein